MFLKSFLTLFWVLHCGRAIDETNEFSYYHMPPLFGLDNYERCIGPNDGVYCVVQVHLEAGANEQLMQNIKEYTSPNFNHTYIDRGICVTEWCTEYVKNTTSDLEWILGACVNDSIYRQYGLEAKVSSFLCDRPKEETVIDASDWIVAGVIGFVILINVVGSLYHVYFLRKFQNEDILSSNTDSLILCFSLFKNWEWMKSKSVHPRLACFRGLQGVRTIAILLTMIVHAMLLYAVNIDNEYFLEEMMPNYWTLANGAMFTQVFFVMTGMLLAFKMELSMEKTPLPWSMVPKIIFFRWLRLTPIYALMLAFSATWMRHLGSGPLWNMMMKESVVTECRQYWWHHILYFNNYVGFVGKTCAGHTWYLAADMQLYIIGVIVLVGTQTRGRELMLMLLIAVGVLAPAIHVWKDDLLGAVLFTPEAFRTLSNPSFYHLHMLGHNNMSGFAVGMAAAVILYRLQNARISLQRYKKYLRFTIPISLALAVFVMYYGCFLFLGNDYQPLWIRMTYQGLHRFFFSLFIAIAILGLALKCDDTICNVLQWDGWIIPSRLCYSVYIVHLLFVSYVQATKTQLTHMSIFNLMCSYLSIVGLSFMTALPICLTVEAPVLAIIDRFKKRDQLTDDHNERNIKLQKKIH